MRDQMGCRRIYWHGWLARNQRMQHWKSWGLLNWRERLVSGTCWQTVHHCKHRIRLWQWFADVGFDGTIDVISRVTSFDGLLSHPGRFSIATWCIGWVPVSWWVEGCQKEEWRRCVEEGSGHNRSNRKPLRTAHSPRTRLAVWRGKTSLLRGQTGSPWGQLVLQGGGRQCDELGDHWCEVKQEAPEDSLFSKEEVGSVMREEITAVRSNRKPPGTARSPRRRLAVWQGRRSLMQSL